MLVPVVHQHSFLIYFYSLKQIQIEETRAAKATRAKVASNELSGIILSDEEDMFAINLEKLALKKSSSSNKELFNHIKEKMDKELKKAVTYYCRCKQKFIIFIPFFLFTLPFLNLLAVFHIFVFLSL